MNARSAAIQKVLGASAGTEQRKPGPHHDFANLTPSATARFPGGRWNSEMRAMRSAPVQMALGTRPGKMGQPFSPPGLKGRDLKSSKQL
jgi:hypothetical protein